MSEKRRFMPKSKGGGRGGSKVRDGMGSLLPRRAPRGNLSKIARLETQSAQAQKMQAVGQLAGGVAHDFNNILTAIIAACDLLPQGEFSEVAEIRKNAERGANLVHQLLAFSRRQVLRPVALDVAERTRGICDLVRRLLGAPIKLELDIRSPIWPVLADPTQFEQIVVNLAVNARDAMPGGGRLFIHICNVSSDEVARLNHILMPVGDYVLFEMRDTGCGIAEAELGNIFEPFFSTKAQGSGLGLSTVYGIIKQSDGFIFPRSEVGCGTVFKVYLPRLEEGRGWVGDIERGGEEGLGASVGVRGVASANRYRVLLVEDDPTIRNFAARALLGEGFEVLVAASAEEALGLRVSVPIDVLVSDIVMSGMDGIRLAESLAERHGGMRVILISGYAESAFRDPQERLAEKIRFLPKPFGLKELILAVRAALEGREEERGEGRGEGEG